MHFFRCVIAEWTAVRPRLLRTRSGLSLLLLGAALLWLGRDAEPLAIALQAGALGAVLGAAAAAGGEIDRAALAVSLSHPTTPLAIAAGRWFAALVPAATLVLACTIARDGPVSAAAAGLAAAAAVGGSALAAVLAMGNAAAVVLFIYMALAGAVSPERLVSLADPGVLRLTVASALELGPALWRYRDVAAGDAGAVVHAVAWAALGILLASGLVRRLARRDARLP